MPKNSWSELYPYWFLLLVIGFGWFVLAPLVPALSKTLNANIDQILLLISLYGYTMVIFGLLAGWLTARFTVKAVLYIAAILAVIGFIGRALASDYILYFVMVLIGAIAYPLAMAPVGSISESLFKERSHTVVGISVGILFFGMALGAFFAPALYNAIGLSGISWLLVLLSIIAALWIMYVVKDYPTYYKGKSLKGTFKIGMIKNWYIGLAIASMSVMFGGIASTVLKLNNFSEASALTYAGLFGGLAFLGSAIGAMLLPPIFEAKKALKLGLIVTSILAFISIVVMSFSLAYTNLVALIALGYFFFGFFGNAFWSMALTSTTAYVDDPAKAGFSTSMYSVMTNLGVAIIPVLIGPLFSSQSTIASAIIIVLIIELIAVILAPTLKTSNESSNKRKKTR